MLQNHKEVMSAVETAQSIQISISDALVDETWDQFLVNTEGGHHVQTSAWARVKASLGWVVKRVVAHENGNIIGGAQVLLREYPLLGSVAYVTKGPICNRQDRRVVNRILDHVQALCLEQRCQLIAIQPPNNGFYMEPLLRDRRFEKSTLELAPTTTLLIDVSAGLDAVHSNLHKTHRKSIRRGIREGVEVREGDQNDLDAFYQLYVETAKRQRFTPFERSYFDTLWKQLSPYGWIALLLSFYKDEAVCGQILTPFRDSVLIKLFGWSGKYPNYHPTELTIWEVLRWTHIHGYRYCDFEGLDRQSGEEILRGEVPSAKPDYFKFAFGGTVNFFPEAYDYVPNRLFNRIYRWMPPSVGGTSPMSRLLEMVRKR